MYITDKHKHSSVPIIIIHTTVHVHYCRLFKNLQTAQCHCIMTKHATNKNRYLRKKKNDPTVNKQNDNEEIKHSVYTIN